MALAVHTSPVEKKALAESFTLSSVQERPEEGKFILPGGYVDDDGVPHYEIELAPVTGSEEEFLAGVSSNVPAASVMTALLSRCLKRLGSLETIHAGLVRNLLVGDRDYLILKLREMTFGSKIEAIIHCPNAGCGKPMDLAFFLDDFLIERRAVTQRFFTMPISDTASEGMKPCQVEFRLPTGDDQEVCAATMQADEARAIHQLLARCICRLGENIAIDEAAIAALPASAQEAIAEKMRQLAPQVEIELEAKCPECQSTFVTPFDFTAFFLAEMKRRLNNLEREVHFLAWHYHWPAREILSLTRRKRQRYIAILQEEITRRG